MSVAACYFCDDLGGAKRDYFEREVNSLSSFELFNVQIFLLFSKWILELVLSTEGLLADRRSWCVIGEPYT